MSSIHGVHHIHFPNFQGAPLTNQDGFVHLSDANAAPVVAKMFFANVQAGLGTEIRVTFQQQMLPIYPVIKLHSKKSSN